MYCTVYMQFVGGLKTQFMNNSRNGKFKNCTEWGVSKNSRNGKFNKVHVMGSSSRDGMLRKCTEWEF